MVRTDCPVCQRLAIAIVRVTAPRVRIGECPSWLLISLSMGSRLLFCLFYFRGNPGWGKCSLLEAGISGPWPLMEGFQVASSPYALEDKQVNS